MGQYSRAIEPIPIPTFPLKGKVRTELPTSYVGSFNTYRARIFRCTSLLPPKMVPGRE